MGRGRAKAKQTKVARDLKYRSYSTDFSSLERELRGDAYDPEIVTGEDAEDDDEDDQYGDLADRYSGDEDDAAGAYRRIS
ncbi:DUF3073 domain-containing protein [Propionicimonas sp.]|uniref:DUF3073 domain-containing protein n=1 Tax=Propionicimonas sp. TaxID=1955623 RepID=UPI0039E6B658